MELDNILKKFKLGDSNHLEIFIGKMINKEKFIVNNKIFFDILTNYLQKNSWYIKSQYISKKYFIDDIILNVCLNKCESNYLGLTIPFQQTKSIYRKKDEFYEKYKGTYYDLFISNYNLEILDDSLIDFDKTYNELLEELTIYTKKGCNFELHLSIEKNDKNENIGYLVKIVLVREFNLEILKELVEILDLAMSKYKKTEKTYTSVFNYTR